MGIGSVVGLLLGLFRGGASAPSKAVGLAGGLLTVGSIVGGVFWAVNWYFNDASAISITLNGRDILGVFLIGLVVGVVILFALRLDPPAGGRDKWLP